jgi:putative aldouronate transport system permease protein
MYGTIIAFKDFRISRGILASDWVGFDNFVKFFESPFFELVLYNTIIISALKILFEFPMPILFAILLNEVRLSFFKRTIQTVLYLPHFISWVIVGNLAFIFFSPATGVATQWLAMLGIQIDVLMDPSIFRGTLVVSDIWKGLGWGTIIYLAAIVGVNPDLYEASIIDGASKFKQIIYVTIPCISPIIIIMFILRLGHVLDAGFEQIFIMQNPMVYEVSEIIDTYVYKAAFQQGEYALASAVNLFKSIVSLIFVLTANYMVKRITGEGAL